MHKSKITRKARLDIVAMHDTDRVKQLSAIYINNLYQHPNAIYINIPDMSASKYWFKIQESKYQNTLKYPSEKRLILIKTGLKKTLMCCFLL